MQSRFMSAVEACVNVLIGYLVSIVGQIVIFPIFGINVSMVEHAAIGLMFTGISLIRSYMLRRLFNGFRG